MVKVCDKLVFNFGNRFPTKMGTVRSIVPSRYSKGGAFADVLLSKETDEIGNSFSKIPLLILVISCCQVKLLPMDHL